jgi:hypothetical protein
MVSFSWSIVARVVVVRILSPAEAGWFVVRHLPQACAWG